MNQSRIADLESSIAFQEKSIEELSGVLRESLDGSSLYLGSSAENPKTVRLGKRTNPVLLTTALSK